ncbi:DUF6082 family protein [Micromonospora sp. NPDC000089]|uniref:DUF6082 family protein n=1 Tax=unclassified Micromonospora TaxID=2617518 RepID=UPI003681DF28
MSLATACYLSGMHRWSSKWLIITGAALGFIVAVLLSPLLMRVLLRFSDEWGELSDVGQAYGGVSAILSAAALCGITASLILQYRDHRSSLLYNVSQRHFELVRFTLENPVYSRSWGEDGTEEGYGLRSFCNLLTTHWLVLWRVGEIDDETLRGIAKGFFRSDVSRRYWAEVGPGWIKRPSRRDRRFMVILTEELERARASRLLPPTTTPSRASGSPRPENPAPPTGPAIPLLAGMAGGVAAAIFLRASHRDRRRDRPS